jgi:hypothetical protein
VEAELTKALDGLSMALHTLKKVVSPDTLMIRSSSQAESSTKIKAAADTLESIRVALTVLPAALQKSVSGERQGEIKSQIFYQTGITGDNQSNGGVPDSQLTEFLRFLHDHVPS